MAFKRAIQGNGMNREIYAPIVKVVNLYHFCWTMLPVQTRIYRLICKVLVSLKKLRENCSFHPVITAASIVVTRHSHKRENRNLYENIRTYMNILSYSVRHERFGNIYENTRRHAKMYEAFKSIQKSYRSI